MIRLSLLALLVGVAAPLDAQPTVASPGERFDNSARVSFVALGSVEAVADSLVADLLQQECLEVQRGLDEAGVVAISLRDTCPGQTHRGLVRLVDGGDGTVRGTSEAVYHGASTTRQLVTMPTAALFRRKVPVTTLAVPESGQAPCQTVESWRADLDAPPPDDPPRDAPTRDTTVQVTEVPPVLIGGIDGFVQTVRYPRAARRAGAQGRTFVRFTVGETGAVTCADLIVSLRPDLDAEALRAVRATRFMPGTQDGRAVKIRMTLPITFRIQ